MKDVFELVVILVVIVMAIFLPGLIISWVAG